MNRGQNTCCVQIGVHDYTVWVCGRGNASVCVRVCTCIRMHTAATCVRARVCRVVSCVRPSTHDRWQFPSLIKPSHKHVPDILHSKLGLAMHTRVSVDGFSVRSSINRHRMRGDSWGRTPSRQFASGSHCETETCGQVDTRLPRIVLEKERMTNERIKTDLAYICSCL